MVNSAVTDISNERILLNPSGALVRVVDGTLAVDQAPGSWVRYAVATKNWVALDTDTAADHGTSMVGVVGYRKRVNQTTGALKLITDDWDTSEAEDKRVPIITSGIVVAKCDDPGAAAGVGTNFQASGTGETVKLQAIVANEGIVNETVATLASNLANGDTVGIFGIGAYRGAIWGGAY
jgi:hypothetical protein